MDQGSDSIASALQFILPRLREQFGVASIGIFGSCARDQATTDSDVDVFVSFNREARVTLLTLAAMTRMLEAQLHRPVDLVEDHPRLTPSLRREIEKDIRRVA